MKKMIKKRQEKGSNNNNEEESNIQEKEMEEGDDEDDKNKKENEDEQEKNLITTAISTKRNIKKKITTNKNHEKDIELKQNDESDSKFNALPLIKKHSIIEKLIKSQSNDNYNSSFLKKIENIILYLESQDIKEHPCINISHFSSLKSSIVETSVSILNEPIILLFKNKKLNTPEMANIIGSFENINFELKYPQSSFDEIHEELIKMKTQHNQKMNITIFITGITVVYIDRLAQG